MSAEYKYLEQLRYTLYIPAVESFQASLKNLSQLPIDKNHPF